MGIFQLEGNPGAGGARAFMHLLTLHLSAQPQERPSDPREPQA